VNHSLCAFCRYAVLLAALLALCLTGCAKPMLPGVEPAGPCEPGTAGDPTPVVDPAALPKGWGYVDVLCTEGQGKDRGKKDTLFGCLLHARDNGSGTIVLPHGVYLGHVADFMVKALRFYDVEQHFEQLYGYRIVLVFRPATPEETSDMENSDTVRFAAGTAGEVALTAVGAPFVPIVAPVVFVFEAVSEDQEFLAFKREAEARGWPEPTRRGDRIVADEYVARYGRYWDAVAGEEAAPEDRVPVMFVVEQCYLAHPTKGRTRLAENAAAVKPAKKSAKKPACPKAEAVVLPAAPMTPGAGR